MMDPMHLVLELVLSMELLLLDEVRRLYKAVKGGTRLHLQHVLAILPPLRQLKRHIVCTQELEFLLKLDCNVHALKCCPCIHYSVISRIKGFRNTLVDLDVSGIQFSYDAYKNIGCCHNLRKLALMGTSVNDSGFRAMIKGMKGLLCLFLNSSAVITDKGIKSLARYCPELRVIDFAHCVRLTSSSIALLAESCSNLHCVHLDGCYGVDDIGVSALALRCARECVSFSYCNITDTAINNLTTGISGDYNARWVTKVNIRGCKQILDYSLISLVTTAGYSLNHLDFSFCDRLSDLLLLQISIHCKALQTLEVRHCINITDASVMAVLTRCPSLSFLDVHSTSVGQELYEYLMSKNPSKKISIDLSGNPGFPSATIDTIRSRGYINLEIKTLEC
jgi:hypothetical protein